MISTEVKANKRTRPDFNLLELFRWPIADNQDWSMVKYELGAKNVR